MLLHFAAALPQRGVRADNPTSEAPREEKWQRQGINESSQTDSDETESHGECDVVELDASAGACCFGITGNH